jgi:hypothetical protein
VTTSIGAHFYSLQMHPERLKCQVSHFHSETRLFRESLPKGDAGAERRFKSATDATFYVVHHELLEELVYLASNRAWYVDM